MLVTAEGADCSWTNQQTRKEKDGNAWGGRRRLLEGLQPQPQPRSQMQKQKSHCGNGARLPLPVQRVCCGERGGGYGWSKLQYP